MLEISDGFRVSFIVDDDVVHLKSPKPIVHRKTAAASNHIALWIVDTK